MYVSYTKAKRGKSFALAVVFVLQLRDFELEKRNPRSVLAVILGGGAGTRLFPLTRRRAKPAVSILSIALRIAITFLFI